MSSSLTGGWNNASNDLDATNRLNLGIGQPLDTSNNFLIYASIGLGGCGLIIFILVTIRRCYKRRCLVTNSSQRGKSSGSSFLSLSHELKELATLPHGTTGGVSHIFRNPAFVSAEVQLQSREFPRTRLCFIGEQGTGTFGKVYRGEASAIRPDEMTTTVYVKTLANSQNEKTREDFHSEMVMATQFNHPHIIELLGVSTVEEPQYLIYECLEYGSLKDFLQYVMQGFQVKDADASSVELDHRKHMVSDEDLARMATQVASALDYLAKHNFVHSDVAARNCQVGSGLKIKLSEFGLNKDINSRDYYHVGKKLDILLPVRWMSPEAIKQRVFTVQNDIWSFGVLMWEMFTFGKRPYSGKTNGEAISAIVKYQRLPYPEGCPREMYELMLKCWDSSPYRRPRYTDIQGRLEGWIKELREGDIISLSSLSSVAL